MDKVLHIIALNIPWPANYGGVIDIYYKMKALHACGVRIILHCFEYERERASELESLCESVHYYVRRTGMLSNLTFLPYNVYSRKDNCLINNLLKDDHPILFEGLHTCYYLCDKRLSNRLKIFRSSNIEHDYYREIGIAERNVVKKCYYHIESLRFKAYQKNVIDAGLMLAVSESDAAYFRSVFPDCKVEFMPCFHEHNEVIAVPGKSDYLLYHGKLSVKENEKAAIYMIQNVFKNLPYRCIVAGMDPPSSIFKAAAPYANIVIEANPSTLRMNTLIREAHINLLVTFQGTGLKLKLLNSLFAGRHVVVNSLMLAGSGLDALCHIADTPDQLIAICRELMLLPFTTDDIEKRKGTLFPTYSNIYQARKLNRAIYRHE